MGERRGCSRVTNIMNEFSRWIDELELHDPYLSGGKFTWFRGDNHPSAARLDRFLYSMSWEENFKSIKQSTLPRVGSDHNPVMLESGNWEHRKPCFKFENWWLKVDGFNDMVQGWWNNFEVEGCPDYKLSSKLKMLKQKLKDWSKKNFSEAAHRKNCLLEELAELDRIQNDRILNDEEMVIKTTILV